MNIGQGKRRDVSFLERNIGELLNQIAEGCSTMFARAAEAIRRSATFPRGSLQPDKAGKLRDAQQGSSPLMVREWMTGMELVQVCQLVCL